MRQKTAGRTFKVEADVFEWFRQRNVPDTEHVQRDDLRQPETAAAHFAQTYRQSRGCCTLAERSFNAQALASIRVAG
jgi:hypothetical protein